jgi:TRADD-N domain-containing protein
MSLQFHQVPAEAPRGLPPEEFAAEIGGGKAVEKTFRGKVQTTFPLRLEIPQTRRDSHFPTAPATTVSSPAPPRSFRTKPRVLTYDWTKNRGQVTSYLAACSGIITEFIGVTFMVIYRSTMAQANQFMEVLERINTVGMAVQILDAIPEQETQLKNSTRAEIVSLLLSINTWLKPENTNRKTKLKLSWCGQPGT